MSSAVVASVAVASEGIVANGVVVGEVENKIASVAGATEANVGEENCLKDPSTGMCIRTQEELNEILFRIGQQWKFHGWNAGREDFQKDVDKHIAEQRVIDIESATRDAKKFVAEQRVIDIESATRDAKEFVAERLADSESTISSLRQQLEETQRRLDIALAEQANSPSAPSLLIEKVVERAEQVLPPAESKVEGEALVSPPSEPVALPKAKAKGSLKKGKGKEAVQVSPEEMAQRLIDDKNKEEAVKKAKEAVQAEAKKAKEAVQAEAKKAKEAAQAEAKKAKEAKEAAQAEAKKAAEEEARKVAQAAVLEAKKVVKVEEVLVVAKPSVSVSSLPAGGGGAIMDVAISSSLNTSPTSGAVAPVAVKSSLDFVDDDDDEDKPKYDLSEFEVFALGKGINLNVDLKGKSKKEARSRGALERLRLLEGYLRNAYADEYEKILEAIISNDTALILELLALLEERTDTNLQESSFNLSGKVKNAEFSVKVLKGNSALKQKVETTLKNEKFYDELGELTQSASRSEVLLPVLEAKNKEAMIHLNGGKPSPRLQIGGGGGGFVASASQPRTPRDSLTALKEIVASFSHITMINGSPIGENTMLGELVEYMDSNGKHFCSGKIAVFADQLLICKKHANARQEANRTNIMKIRDFIIKLPQKFPLLFVLFVDSSGADCIKFV